MAGDFPGAASWRKSTHSNGDGGECVEVGEGFPGAAAWRKSSHSNTSGGNCLEVADDVPGVVPVRDSKVPDGDVLVVSARAWVPFVRGLKGGAFRG
ncbi:DUF397 domain-containing protein [Streptomyces kanasensis]|uniref:DUF397 domain-containing protein n=1 Tax=Streptomyces kanasensis TaxID=936756 RepID=UPI0036FA24FC